MADGLIFVSMPYSAPAARTVTMRMDIWCREMARYVLRGEPVIGVLWYHFALEHEPKLGTDWAAWKAYAEALILKSSKVRVIKVHGWDQSEGVKGEIEFAEANGIPVEYVKAGED